MQTSGCHSSSQLTVSLCIASDNLSEQTLKYLHFPQNSHHETVTVCLGPKAIKLEPSVCFYGGLGSPLVFPPPQLAGSWRRPPTIHNSATRWTYSRDFSGRAAPHESHLIVTACLPAQSDCVRFDIDPIPNKYRVSITNISTIPIVLEKIKVNMSSNCESWMNFHALHTVSVDHSPLSLTNPSIHFQYPAVIGQRHGHTLDKSPN